ncbi:MAG: polysaccharide biosynthesis tyrosine autokinase, partial [Alphaproteobacteria bacterium]
MANPGKVTRVSRQEPEEVTFIPVEEVGRPAPVASTREFDLRQFFAILLRNKMLILGVIVIGTLLTIFMVQRMTPLYSAQASLVLQRQQINISGRSAEAVVQGLNPDLFTNETEAEIIRSRSLALKVVEQLDLANNPIFNPPLSEAKVGLIGSLKNALGISSFKDIFPESWRTSLGMEDAESAEAPVVLSAAQKAQNLREQLVDVFLTGAGGQVGRLFDGGLEVEAGGTSLVIDLIYVSPDPEMSALAVNTVADIYILEQLNAKYEATERANRWLADRVGELRLRVEGSSRILESFRRRAGLVNIGDTTLYAQQLAELNTQSIVSRTVLAEAEARFNQVQRLLETPGGLDSAAAVLESPLIQRLREQESELTRNIAELEIQYRDAHPKMMLARSELEDLQKKINQEVNKVAINLGNELEITEIRQEKLEAEIERLQSRVSEQNQAEVKLNELTSVAQADRELYETVLARFKQVDTQQQQLIEPDARVISYATVPQNPSRPRKSLIIGAGFILSGLIGFLLAFVREQLESGFRSVDQVEEVTGIPAIAMLPRISGANKPGKAPYDMVIDRPTSSYAEAVRTLRTALLLSDVDRPPRTIAITSSVPGEGKTTAALALARAAAKSGQKVLVIDCDLRKPSLHNALQVPNSQGIVDYLSHEKELEDVIEIDFKSEAHYILAGPSVSNATDVLASNLMSELLEALADTYDLVVLDTPPVLAVSD